MNRIIRVNRIMRSKKGQRRRKSKKKMKMIKNIHSCYWRIWLIWIEERDWKDINEWLSIYHILGMTWYMMYARKFFSGQCRQMRIEQITIFNGLTIIFKKMIFGECWNFRKLITFLEASSSGERTISEWISLECATYSLRTTISFLSRGFFLNSLMNWVFIT